MTQEGLLREHVKKWDEFEDIVCYGILQSEWAAGGNCLAKQAPCDR